MKPDPESSQLTEIGSRYTFFCSGRPKNEPRKARVGFAINNRYLNLLDSVPYGDNERLMSLRVHLEAGYVSLISAYAPTMTQPDETKEQLYEELDKLLQAVHRSDSPGVATQFLEKSENALNSIRTAEMSLDDHWCPLREALHSSAEETIGFVKRKHRDWFDKNDPIVQDLQVRLHNAHTRHVMHKSSQSRKDSYLCLKREAQATPRDIKNSSWKDRADDLQLAYDRKAVYVTGQN